MKRGSRNIRTVKLNRLDKETSPLQFNGQYVSVFPLVVITSAFGTRGFDYGAPTNGLTLVVAESSAHEREAVQLANRVGRFG